MNGDAAVAGDGDDGATRKRKSGDGLFSTVVDAAAAAAVAASGGARNETAVS